jgi:hypothetical protein
MDTPVTVPSETIINKIFDVRGKKVMVDRDLARLYDVETRVLVQSVKRNLDRFPSDFMFQLDANEAEYLRSQIVISNEGRGGRRYLPYVFTEQGMAMLSSILNSPQAIHVNIQIIRTFSKLREILIDNKKLAEKLEAMERKYDKHIYQIFAAIKSLEAEKKKPVIEEKPKEKIGFRLPGQ